MASGVWSGAEASGDVATVTLLEPPPSTTTESGRTVAPQPVSNLAGLQFGDGRLQFGDASPGRRKSGFRRVFVAGSFSPGPTIHPLRVPQGAVTNGARNRGEPGAKLETYFARFPQIGDRGWNTPDVDAAPGRFPGSVRARSARAVRCMYPSSSRAQLSSRAGGLGAAQGRLSGACGSSPIWANWRRPVLRRRLQFDPAVSKLETAGRRAGSTQTSHYDRVEEWPHCAGSPDAHSRRRSTLGPL